MLDNKSLFGKDFKYILSMTALVWMAYTLPQVQASFTSSVGDSVADLGSSFSASASTQVAQVYSSPSPSPSPSSVCSAALMATISLDPSSPIASTLPVTSSTTSSYMGLPVLVFDFGATSGNLHPKTIVVHFGSTGASSLTTAYLYRGSTQVAAANVVNGIATFSNLPTITVSQGTYVPFTVKVDVMGVTSSTGITASVYSSDTIAQDQYNNGASVSGSAYGNTQTIVASGPVFSLSGAPTISKHIGITDASGNTTVTYTATFNINVMAVGTSVTMGTAQAQIPAFGAMNPPITLAQIIKNGVPTSLAFVGGVRYAQPAGTTGGVSYGTFVISPNQTVTIPVSYNFNIVNPGSDVYALQVTGANTIVNFAANYISLSANSWKSSSI